MNNSSSNRFAGVLLVAAFFAAFLGLGRAHVITDNEGQRTTPPAEMLRTGDYLVPTLNGVDYLVKPPLLYWAIAGVYRVTGVVSPLTARVPTALSGVILVLCVYFAFRREAAEGAARWGALAVLASPYVLQMVRTAELDIPLTLATFLSIVAVGRACSAEAFSARVWFLLASGAAFGAAVMLKGPVPFLFLWAAMIAGLATRGGDEQSIMRSGIRWSMIAFALQCVLYGIGQVAPAISGLVGLPVPLLVVFITWTALALRHGGTRRWRTAGFHLAVAVMGAALAAPWAIAVLHRKGWPYISAMLNEQVVERTHTASEINSGAPWFYLVAIAGMLAPWSLLLPLQFSRADWNGRTSAYRFSVVMGWLSVLVFSLIAGKETEYILPCVPFLLLATGHHLSQMHLGLRERWMESWARTWQRGALALLALVLPAGAIYLSITMPQPTLLFFIWPLTLVALAMIAVARGSLTYRNSAIFVATLCALLIAFLARAHYYVGDRSPRDLARYTASLLESGITVEASKVYPAFAFYAGVNVPIEISVERVRQKFDADAPYAYLTRKGFLGMAGVPNPHVLAGPIRFKELILISNRPLP